MSDATQTEQGFALPTPGKEHQRMQPFEGTFRAEVKIWMGAGDPNISTGKMVNSFALGGLFLKQDYKGDPGDGPFPDFEGHGFWGYNIVDKRYEGLWIDTASTMMQIETGQVSGDTWTMTGKMTCAQTGQQLKKRSVITLIDDDHHKMEMFFAGDDGNEMKAMEINYERA